jgi:hypothetical protein
MGGILKVERMRKRARGRKIGDVYLRLGFQWGGRLKQRGFAHVII